MEKIRELEDKRINDIQKTQFKNQEKVRQIEGFHNQQMKHLKDRMEEVSLKMKLEKMDLENKLQKTQHNGNEKI